MTRAEVLEKACQQIIDLAHIHELDAYLLDILGEVYNAALAEERAEERPRRTEPQVEQPQHDSEE
jgi:hypothetical protein